jgi:hypothetical protein
MYTTLELSIFGKPSFHGPDEGQAVTPEELRQVGQGLQQHLDHTAAILGKLQAGGWNGEMRLYDVAPSHPAVHSEADARARLQALGIDPKDVGICEDEDADAAELTEDSSAAV